MFDDDHLYLHFQGTALNVGYMEQNSVVTFVKVKEPFVTTCRTELGGVVEGIVRDQISLMPLGRSFLLACFLTLAFF